MGEIQSEDAVVDVENSRVGVEVGGRAGEGWGLLAWWMVGGVTGVLTLDVDSPLVGAQAKRLEGALLAERLGLVDKLVAAVVAGTGVALGVLVCGG
jgi:hypothetical protein